MTHFKPLILVFQAESSETLPKSQTQKIYISIFKFDVNPMVRARPIRSRSGPVPSLHGSHPTALPDCHLPFASPLCWMVQFRNYGLWALGDIYPRKSFKKSLLLLHIYCTFHFMPPITHITSLLFQPSFNEVSIYTALQCMNLTKIYNQFNSLQLITLLTFLFSLQNPHTCPSLLFLQTPKLPLLLQVIISHCLEAEFYLHYLCLLHLLPVLRFFFIL